MRCDLGKQGAEVAYIQHQTTTAAGAASEVMQYH